MGMTIEDARIALGKERKYALHENKQAFDIAIDTMRKYQKIREIAFPLQFCSTDKLEHEAIMKICGVIEDANNKQAN